MKVDTSQYYIYELIDGMEMDELREKINAMTDEEFEQYVEKLKKENQGD